MAESQRRAKALPLRLQVPHERGEIRIAADVVQVWVSREQRIRGQSGLGRSTQPRHGIRRLRQRTRHGADVEAR